jgi:hypothetical protein
MDDDNLTSALKAIRDQIASLIGVDDGDHSIEWRYEQRADKTERIVEIEVKTTRRRR